MKTPSIKNKKSSKGFTLLEIIIALFIFTIIAVLVAQILFMIVNTRQDLQQKETEFSHLQIVMHLFREDCQQIVDRPISDNTGGVSPSVLLTIYPNEYFEFSRGSLQQGLALSRVAYVVKNRQLLRLTWPVLDRVPNTQAYQQVLLNDVSFFSVKILNNKKVWSEVWPMANDDAAFPKAVKLSLCLFKRGCIENLTIIPVEVWNGKG